MTHDPSMSAAEYVLGTLDSGERAAFARRMDVDPALGAAVRDWETRLAPMNGVVEPIEPNLAVWQAIERRLDQATGGNVVQLRRSVVRWRVASGLSAALAASLALFVGRPIQPVERPQQTAAIERPAETPTSRPAQTASGLNAGPPAGVATASGGRPSDQSAVVTANATRGDSGGVALGVGQPLAEGVGAAKSEGVSAAKSEASPAAAYMAALAPSATPAALVARIDAGARVLVVRRLNAIAPADAVLELWAVAPGGEPKPLGRLDSEITRFAVPRDMPIDGLTILVTREAATSVAPQRPSGPPLYEGKLIRD